MQPAHMPTGRDDPFVHPGRRPHRNFRVRQGVACVCGVLRFKCDFTHRCCHASYFGLALMWPPMNMGSDAPLGHSQTFRETPLNCGPRMGRNSQRAAPEADALTSKDCPPLRP
jgi:hypothetical protein